MGSPRCAGRGDPPPNRNHLGQDRHRDLLRRHRPYGETDRCTYPGEVEIREPGRREAGGGGRGGGTSASTNTPPSPAVTTMDASRRTRSGTAAATTDTTAGGRSPHRSVPSSS